jgi:hypothetical protein
MKINTELESVPIEWVYFGTAKNSSSNPLAHAAIFIKHIRKLKQDPSV